jgi:hypothetical protein
MEYICKTCNKHYKSYQSLWNHNHKYHDMNANTKNTNGIHSEHIMSTNGIHSEHNKLIEDETNKNNICKFCKKELYNRQSRWRHELKCEIKNSQENIKSELVEIKNELKQLKENKKNNKITNNIKVTGTLINGNNNDSGPKIIINKTGTENIDQISYNEVSTIFDNEISSVIKLIELVNFNEYKPGSKRTTRLLTKLKDAPENHSFCSTALESPYLSFYNTDTNTVNKERKRYFFEEIICKSIQNHEILYSKFKNKFNFSKRKQIEDNIYNLKKIRENSFNSKIIGEMIRNLNLLSYNNRDLIQGTWCADQASLIPISTKSRSGKKYDHESDDEFMAMLLDDPETQKIIENNKKKLENIYDSDSEERIILPFKFNKK